MFVGKSKWLTDTLCFHVATNVVAKSWGYEEIIYNQEYCLKILSVRANQGCSMHYHVNKKETFYVTMGELRVEYIDPKTGKCSYVKLRVGEAITLTPGQAHRFKAGAMGAEFIESSSHDEAADSYRVCASNLGESEWRYGSTEVKNFRKEDNSDNTEEK